jgi:hypothetical protein
MREPAILDNYHDHSPMSAPLTREGGEEQDDTRSSKGPTTRSHEEGESGPHKGESEEQELEDKRYS